MNWLVVLPLEVTAGLKILQFWEHTGSFQIPEAASVTIFLVVGHNPGLSTSGFTTDTTQVIFGINLCGVRTYGESEFGASIVKAAAVFGFM